jgi:hypothetical protein
MDTQIDNSAQLIKEHTGRISSWISSRNCVPRPLDCRDPIDDIVILFLATPSLQPLRDGLVEGAVKGFY